MHDAEDGIDHIIGGQYKKVIDNKVFNLTWQWEGNPVATHVAICFKVLTNKTSELVLVHTEFTEQAACDKHEMGWNGCLNNLPKALS